MNLDEYKCVIKRFDHVGNVRLYAGKLDEPLIDESGYLPVSDYGPYKCPYCGCDRIPEAPHAYNTVDGYGGWSWGVFGCLVVAAIRTTPAAVYVLGISERTLRCKAISQLTTGDDVV